MHRAVETAIQIADAIADAHANGFVHGGLSPESVALTQKGHAKIPAFELAAHGGFDSANAHGEVRLLDYLSPEEAAGQPPDDRSDIYSSRPPLVQGYRTGLESLAPRRLNVGNLLRLRKTPPFGTTIKPQYPFLCLQTPRFAPS